MDFKVLMGQLNELSSPVQKRHAIKVFVEKLVEKHGTTKRKLFIDIDYQADKILPVFKDIPNPPLSSTIIQAGPPAAPL